MGNLELSRRGQGEGEKRQSLIKSGVWGGAVS